MASYNVVRTAEAQPIGSIVPWVGKLTKIPPGWLLCNGQELEASEYPLLARILRDTYGGAGFTGDFPNYEGTFQLPALNQKGLVDISTEYFTDEINNTQPGADQPTHGIDSPESLNVVQGYIGSNGDINAPSVTFGITDLDMSYIPDPDGILENFTFVGTAVNTSIPILYPSVTHSNVPGSGGSGAVFNVIRNPPINVGENSYYTIAVKAKGAGYEVGDTLTISYTAIGGASSANDITITVTVVGNGFFSGTISGGNTVQDDLEFTPGFGIAPVTVVPRKLGREHFPPHFHDKVIDTISTNDAAENPGRGVGIWLNPEITVIETWFGENSEINGLTGARVYLGNSSVESGNIWGDSDSSQQVKNINCPFEPGPGRYALASITGTRPARTHIPYRTAADAHGVAKAWFTNLTAKNLRDSNDNNTVNGYPALDDLLSTGKITENTPLPFSDDAIPARLPNYDDGPAANLGSDSLDQRKEILYNHAATSFTKITRSNPSYIDVIATHNHQGEFNIQYDPGSLSLQGNFQAFAEPNVIPDSVPNAFQITFQTTSPSLAVINLIRAY